MSTPFAFPRTWLLLATIAACVGVTSIQATASGPEAARLETFTKADGTNCFALGLQPGDGTPRDDGPRSVVLVFDTAASQMGEYRSKALATLEALLGGLRAEDRVQLLAADLDVVPLTEGFVAPRGPAIDAALAKLRARTPLGSTDMENVLTAVLARCGSAPGVRAGLYLGQGRSPANLISPPAMKALLAKLVAARVSISSYAVGPRLDLHLLGVLAAHTGGQVLREVPDVDAAQAGRELGQALQATVYWPDPVAWPANLTEVFPKSLPPLRSDRDSVVVGTYRQAQPLEIAAAVHTASGEARLSWSVAPRPSNPDNCYLPQLLSLVRVDGGLSLPAVGLATLEDAKQQSYLGARGLCQLAGQALSAGNRQDAMRLADEALRRDPENPEAQSVMRLASQKRGKCDLAEAGGAAPGDLNLVGPPAEAVPAPGAVLPPDGAAAAAFDTTRRQFTQQMQAHVRATVDQARRQMATNPAGAMQDLKLLLEDLRQVRELPPDVQSQLVDVVQAAVREADRRTLELESRRQRQLETEATLREQQVLADNLLHKQEAVKQLMGRFNALMDEGRYRWAEEATAGEISRIDPASEPNHTDNTIAVSSTINAHLQGTWHEMMEIHNARAKLLYDTMASVERSHIPSPDDVPIVYPDPEVWRDLTERRKEFSKAVDLSTRGPRERKIEEELQKPTTLEFIETPFSDVLGYLKDLHGIEIQLDTKSLTDVGVAADTPITKNLKGVTLRSALRLLLRDLQLTYMIQDEVLLITTQEQADTRLKTKVYPVADLVIPVRGVMNPSMGGIMGGGGGMGGGMGGGGMGGGGMGGGGGGFGGGGMFNLNELLKNGPINGNMPQGGFQAFAVKDDLSAAPAAARTPAAAPAPATVKLPKPAEAQKMDLDLAAGGDPDAVWEKHFSTHQDPPATVRDGVRRLMEQKHYDHAAALICAALRHGQAQPWMYEALSIAMQLAGAPPEEIERVIMSAADLAEGPDAQMCLAVYLHKNHMYRRALKLFRQVALQVPARPEPYVYGLATAQAANDLEGIQWATLGICSRAWRSEQAEIYRKACRVADDVLAQLKDAKKNAAAAEFKQALDSALQRDCVILVKWTGDADVDLLVEEPTGTVCSCRNPLTTSGGVLLGDATSTRPLVKSNDGSTSEVYVCPEAFSGSYRALVRCVWGQVTAGKVTVQIWEHYRGPKQLVQEKKISLEKGEAVVAIDLKDGRRRESLRDFQIANAIAGQVEMNQQILGQVLDQAADPAVLASLSDSNSGDSLLDGLLGRRGAVGYQPVIIWLPKGCNFSTGPVVVSADRRYVRIQVPASFSGQPMFSGVTDVQIFNMAAGTETSTTQGTGTGGFSSF